MGMPMEITTTSIVDIDLKVGANERGDWTLCTATGADKNKYKTFDENLTAQLKQALKTKAPIKISYEPKQKDYNGKSYVDRTIKAVGVASVTPAAVAAQAPTKPAAKGNDRMPPEYWEKKDRLEFERMGHMSALKAAAEVMVALLGAKVESYKFEDALLIVKSEANKLYAEFYKAYEGGNSNAESSDSRDIYDECYDAGNA